MMRDGYFGPLLSYKKRCELLFWVASVVKYKLIITYVKNVMRETDSGYLCYNKNSY